MQIRQLVFIILFLTGVTTFVSCSKKDSGVDMPGTPVLADLQISSFTPANGIKGTSVTITGTGFSTNPTENTVTFNGVAAAVTAVTATSITVTVPIAAGNGKIAVRSANRTSRSTDDFKYIYSVSTFAGSGTFGFADGPGNLAAFKDPYGLATDAAGNIYVADSDNNLIRKITTAGVVSTIAGDGTIGSKNGAALTAQFNYPHGIVLDATGNIYVADAGNDLIRKITPAGVVSTLAGDGNAGLVNGAGNMAEFNFPGSIAIDAAGNLFVTDGTNKCIRKITPAGMVSTFTAAVFSFPEGIAIDATGNLYVVDSGKSLIRKVTTNGDVSIFAGSTYGFADGAPGDAKFDTPEGIAIDAAGNLYVGDLANNAIRKITPAGAVLTIAGNGTHGLANGIGTDARFYAPSSTIVDAAGNIYVGDTVNSLIRKVQ